MGGEGMQVMPPVVTVSITGTQCACALKVSAVAGAGAAASRATRVPPVKRVSQVGGCSYHHRNPVLVLRFEDVIGTSDGW